ncbi:hypothetical protein, partial [Staphylococcus aureus]|uniref:hypothetical protein n=1 Tax=Staphylococcus aureus TaxID=1280 RepID=UPI002041AE82
NAKTTREGGVSKVQQTGKFLNRGNSLVRDMSPNLSFQCSRSQATTSRTLRNISRTFQLPVAAASGDLSCLSGLDPREQLPEQAQQ